MPDNLAEKYDRGFFSDYGAANPTYSRCCAMIAEEIARRFAPKSVVDWGCGAGLHAAALMKIGIEVVAIDAVEAPADLRAPDVEILRLDLRNKIPDGLVPDRYDLSLCIDVMEHIEERHAMTILKTITRGAGLLILSCAPPGQGGHNHVNEQPRRYWVERLAEIGWKYDRKETGSLERSFLERRAEFPISWMYHNLCVYRSI